MVGTQFCHVVLRVKDLLDLHGQGLESALHLADVGFGLDFDHALGLGALALGCGASRAAANAAAWSVPAAAPKFPDVCEPTKVRVMELFPSLMVSVPLAPSRSTRTAPVVSDRR
jgi:hypothetical protein